MFAVGDDVLAYALGRFGTWSSARSFGAADARCRRIARDPVVKYTLYQRTTSDRYQPRCETRIGITGQQAWRAPLASALIRDIAAREVTIVLPPPARRGVSIGPDTLLLVDPMYMGDRESRATHGLVRSIILEGTGSTVLVGSEDDAMDDCDANFVERDTRAPSLDRPSDSIVVQTGDRFQWYRLGPAPARPKVATQARVPNRPEGGRPSQMGR